MGKSRRKPKNPTRQQGMSWEDIQKYDGVIRAITIKYSGDRTLQEDVAQEVRLALHTDRRLDISTFNPKKRDAAIRNTIRNKAIKILRSKKLGRWQFESLDTLQDFGFQIDAEGVMHNPVNRALGPPVDRAEGEEI